MEKTIKVTKWNDREVEMTQAEFAEQWVSQLSGLSFLTRCKDELNMVEEIRGKIKWLCEVEFDRIYTDQQEKRA